MPSANCDIGARPHRAITRTRQRFEARYGTATDQWAYVGQKVTLTGVRFFDFSHGQTGVADNAVPHPGRGTGPAPACRPKRSRRCRGCQFPRRLRGRGSYGCAAARRLAGSTRSPNRRATSSCSPKASPPRQAAASDRGRRGRQHSPRESSRMRAKRRWGWRGALGLSTTLASLLPNRSTKGVRIYHVLPRTRIHSRMRIRVGTHTERLLSENSGFEVVAETKGLEPAGLRSKRG
jgi:hypothetical protein